PPAVTAPAAAASPPTPVPAPAVAAHPGPRLHPAAPEEAARLTVGCSPVARLFVDGKDLGWTPVLAAELPAGHHAIRLTNDALGVVKESALDLAANEVKKLAF